jgi:hypothetical protein
MKRHIAERLSVFPIKYAKFALSSGNRDHLAAAKAQIGT